MTVVDSSHGKLSFEDKRGRKQMTEKATAEDGNDNEEEEEQGRIPDIRCAWHAFFLNANGHTDPRTYGHTDGRTDGRTHPLIEMRRRI